MTLIGHVFLFADIYQHPSISQHSPYGYPLAGTLTQHWRSNDTLEDLDSTANNVHYFVEDTSIEHPDKN